MQSSTSPLSSESARPALTPSRLLGAFAQVPDPRRAQGRRYPLAALLALAVLAILCNHLSVLAIAQWGREQDPATLDALGFRSGKAPHQSTLQRLFAKLDPDALIARLGTILGQAVPLPSERAEQGVSVDGKAQRGRLAADPTAGVIHVLSAFCHDYGVVLAQAPIEHAQDKAEAELTVAPEVIAAVDWRNRVLTGDAELCQRKVCQQVVAAGGDYLLIVKENQPTLFNDIQLLFEPPDPTVTLSDRREAVSVDFGHGRYPDTRRLIASTDLHDYLDWPHHAQVFRWERTWSAKGKEHQAIRYGITSIPPNPGTPDRLLAFKRAPWQVENLLHRPKDTALGEDQSLIHRGHGPDVFSVLRNLAISLLRAAGISTIAAQLRHFSSHPLEALCLLTSFPIQNA